LTNAASPQLFTRCHLLAPLTWFDREIGDVFGLDILVAPGLRERGWAERSNDWVDLQVLRFEDLASLVPQLARFVASRT
jgi:hypothetical protein